MILNRRDFLTATSAAITASTLWNEHAAAARKPPKELAGAIGITTGSFSRHLSAEPEPGKLVLLDLPQIMRDELDMSVIDLMTANLTSLEPSYCEQFRAAAEKADCVVTNLKMNQRVDMASGDASARQEALATYRATIDAAARLGCRWVRPASSVKKPDLKLLADGFRALTEYAAPKGITLLVENNGWMRDDPDAIPKLIEAVGGTLAAQPDTGNWADEARYTGLEKAFPLAVTCDFKAFKLEADGSHDAYDLHRCFQIGWDAGFRGPWCFEHANSDLKMQLKEMALLRDILRGWMKSTQTRVLQQG
jgi:hypothetical protein